jgi:DNA-binding response OmpR family regulator/curved DNA-binding protein CbpA
MRKSDITILIVDDDMAIGKTLSETISRAGYKPLVVHRADEALNVVRIKHVHAAIIDCMLPLTNGISLAEDLRKTRFENGPVILMSGIFKDKAFEQNALRRTQSLAYLEKPFGPNDLLAILKPALDSLLDRSQVSLQTFLTKKLDSTRERVKIIEQLEEIKGIEAAIVLSILMDSKVSGVLNIVDQAGAAFKVNLKMGVVADVTGSEGDNLTIQFLIDTGYLSQQDWNEFSTDKTFLESPLPKLVAAGFISPHAAGHAKTDQMLTVLKQIVKLANVTINLVPNDSEEEAADGLQLASIFAELYQTVDDLLSLQYLNEFFSSHRKTPIKLLETKSSSHLIWTFPIITKVSGVLRNFEKETIEQMVQAHPSKELNLLKALYCLVIFRQIIFVDTSPTKKRDDEINHVSQIYKTLKNKTPFEIFNYFGTSMDARTNEVETVFKEFVRSNHPDKLSHDASPDLVDVSTRLFALMSEAHRILTNPEKREEYQKIQLANLAKNELKAEALAQEGLELLRRGSYSRAEEKIKGSLELAPSNLANCLLIWAKIKAAGSSSKIAPAALNAFQKDLDAIPSASRSEYFHLSLGIIRASSGDLMSATASFEKALTINPNFLEARRELNALQKEVPVRNSTSDILTGDISQIVSQIFKKKIR